MGDSDSDDTDEEEDGGGGIEEENEKSVVLNSGNHSDSSKEVEGSSGSVTGENLASCVSESGCEEEKGFVESDGCAELVQPVISVSTTEAVAEAPIVPSSGNGEALDESTPVTSDSKSSVHDETLATTKVIELEKPLNFDDFNSAAEMEVCF